MIRQENPRTLGLELRGWDLVRQVELEEEILAHGAEFASKAGKGKNRRRASGYGYRQPRVHRHHAPRYGEHRHE